MAQRIHLEYPERDVIESPVAQLMGWCTTDAKDTPFTIHLNDQVFEFGVMDRPDVRRVFPRMPSFGFTRWLSPEDCVALDGRDLNFRFVLGATTLEKTIRYSDAATATAREWVKKKAAKRSWCLSVLRCPVCRAGQPVPADGGALRCPSCETLLEQTTSALNLLPSELYRRFKLKPTDNISAHPYPPPVTELIAEARRAGGKVLDCGAGFRSIQDDSVVNMEIVDYASTDVLAVGQSLPFADASFDAVLSLAVLEHVDDPFTCAAELTRVVKPGGKIYCVVPFLQHEHGYPNHFYNMTRQGMVKLFEGRAKLLSHEVPRYGAPIHVVCSIVQEYLANLPPAAFAEFEKLTMGDMLRLRKDEYWDKAYVQQLSPEGNWRLASVTAALFERDS
jgi:SAM-dependent methyltransferase